MPLTRHGFRELLIGSLVLALTGFGLGWFWWPLALIVLPALVFLFSFFRDPRRDAPAEDGVHTYVSPADGKVSDITPLEDDPLVGGPATRVGIFLSVFNVHINRSPCDGVVKDVIYKQGKFINALDHSKASEHNESNTLVIADPETGEVVAVVKQIVGLIARRIVCTKKIGDTVERGERIGMIKFGSRTELTVPSRLEPDVLVEIGQKVAGGSTVMVGVGGAADEEAEPLAHRSTPA